MFLFRGDRCLWVAKWSWFERMQSRWQQFGIILMHIKPIAYTVVGILFFLARITQESRKHLSPTNNDDSTVNIIHTECF